MKKSKAIVKVDSVENWAKATKYIPDLFTICIYTYGNDRSPKIKMGDGITLVNDLPFLTNREVIEDDTLVL